MEKRHTPAARRGGRQWEAAVVCGSVVCFASGGHKTGVLQFDPWLAKRKEAEKFIRCEVRHCKVACLGPGDSVCFFENSNGPDSAASIHIWWPGGRHVWLQPRWRGRRGWVCADGQWEGAVHFEGKVYAWRKEGTELLQLDIKQIRKVRIKVLKIPFPGVRLLAGAAVSHELCICDSRRPSVVLFDPRSPRRRRFKWCDLPHVDQWDWWQHACEVDGRMIAHSRNGDRILNVDLYMHYGTGLKCVMEGICNENQKLKVRNLELQRSYLRRHKVRQESHPDGFDGIPALDAYKLLRHNRDDPNTMNEHWLFHGSTLSNIEKICERGFDLTLCRDGNFLGRGIYLSPNGSTADHYSRSERCVLIVRANLGNSYPVTDWETHNNLRHQGVPSGHHSAWAAGIIDHLEVVVHDKDQALPAARIFYEHLEDCECSGCR